MIQSIAITNPSSETLTLPFDETMPNTGIVITNVSGLGPVAATVNTESIAGLDGSMYTGAYQRTRNIVFALRLVETDDLTIEECRLKVYQYFPVKGLVKIIVDTDARSVYTVGCVESVEPDIFSSRESVQVSVVCPEPYWYVPEVGLLKTNAATYSDKYVRKYFYSDDDYSEWSFSVSESKHGYEYSSDGSTLHVYGNNTITITLGSLSAGTYVFTISGKAAGVYESIDSSISGGASLAISVAGNSTFFETLTFSTDKKTYSRLLVLDSDVSSAKIVLKFSNGYYYDDYDTYTYVTDINYICLQQITKDVSSALAASLNNFGDAPRGLTLTFTSSSSYSGIYYNRPLCIQCIDADGIVTSMQINNLVPIIYDESFEVVLVSTDQQKSLTYYSLDDDGEHVDSGINIMTNLKDIQTWITLQPGKNSIIISFADDDDPQIYDSLSCKCAWNDAYYGV
ncbi:MAG: phage tail family protein [Oscillospiraceae bacterium]|nr:phage tail family protein [Oscillospiraceae bacterium]